MFSAFSSLITRGASYRFPVAACRLACFHRMSSQIPNEPVYPHINPIPNAKQPAPTKNYSNHLSPYHTDFYDTSIEVAASKPIRTFTLRRLVEFGTNVTAEKLIISARYVQEQLPIRLAKRLLDIRLLPYIMVTNPFVNEVYQLYQDAFYRLQRTKTVNSMDDEREFTELLRELVSETLNIVDLLAKGTKEANRKVPHSRINVDVFLEKMVMGRNGNRMMSEQHIMLHEKYYNGQKHGQTPSQSTNDQHQEHQEHQEHQHHHHHQHVQDDHLLEQHHTHDQHKYPEGRHNAVGIVELKCPIARCVETAVHTASEICRQTYGRAPHVQIVGGLNATVPFIRAHLEYIIIELLKNSMRATIERTSMSEDLMPISILIAEGHKETTIRISDMGGGIQKDIIGDIFQFGFSTFKQKKDFGQDLFGQGKLYSEMAGFGFGLPLSRLFARQFGGDLQLMSMDGYGCDVYICIDRTGNVAEKIEF